MTKYPFTVVAGKYDDTERNCKYIEGFATLDEAIEAYMRFNDYPWCEIGYINTTGTYIIVPGVQP